MQENNQVAASQELPTSPVENTPTPSAPPPVAAKEAEPASKQSFRDALGSHLEALTPQQEKSSGPGQAPVSAQAPLSSSPAANSTQVSPSESAPILAPSDMTTEEKSAFERGDPYGLQKYYARRSYEMRADYRKQTQELETRRKSVDAFEKVIERNKEHYILKGQDPAVIFERALAWDKRISSDPISGALEYLKAYGINPQDLLQANQGRPRAEQPQQAQQYTPEDIQSLVDERLQSQMLEAQQKATAQRLGSVVDKFITSKPVLADPGTADAVIAAMVPFAQAAISANPSADPEKILESVYKFVLSEQFPDLNSRLQARSIAEGKNSEAQKAKQAGKSISGSLSSGEPKRKFKNFRDALEANLR